MAGVEVRGRGGEPDELHVFVERTPGRALRRPRCGAMHGAYDTRERMLMFTKKWSA